MGKIKWLQREILRIGKIGAAVEMLSNDQIFAQGTRVFSMAELGPKLREARKRFGYTQQYVADFMEVSPRLIGEIERGRGTVAFDTVVAYALNMSVDFVAFDRNRFRNSSVQAERTR